MEELPPSVVERLLRPDDEDAAPALSRASMQRLRSVERYLEAGNPPRWMERLAEFRPHLGGAVWHGTATRLSDIYLQLFCDDPKSAEIALIDHNVDYTPRTVTGFNGEPVDALSISSMSRELGEPVGVHLLVYDHDDLRGAMRPDSKGRTPRGGLGDVGVLRDRVDHLGFVHEASPFEMIERETACGRTLEPRVAMNAGART